MARSLSKVQKKISKKKGGRPTALHENSRDAQRLRAAGSREDKMSKLLSAAHRNNKIYVDRVAWFRSAIEGSEDAVSDEELHTLTETFTSRSADELDELKAQRRPGRPISKAQEQVQSQIDAEDREFSAGFWVPDLRSKDNRLRLEKWSGDWAGLNSLDFVRVIKGGVIRPSSFPPKGLS